MRQKVYVLSHGNQWKVQCEHCNEGFYSTQAEAIKAAKQHVGGLPAGTLSQILIQGVGGQFRTEWTYGNDPFPPRG